MDEPDFWLKLVDEVVKLVTGVAWPVVVIVLVMTQRRPLASLIDRIREFDALGVKGKADPSKEIEKLEAAVKVVDDDVKAKQQDKPVPAQSLTIENRQSAELAESVIRQLSYSVDTPPIARIESEWLRVTELLRELFRAKNLDASATGGLPATALLDYARRSGELPPELIQSLRQLVNARNVAVHDSEVRPTMEDANRFAEAAEKLSNALVFYILPPQLGPG